MRAVFPLRQRTKGRAEPPVARLPLHTSDAEILAALKNRLAAGGAALFDRYHAHVRRILVRVLGAESEINDLMQEVFITAIDKIEQVVDHDALRPWLTSIAVFTARRQIRRQARRRLFLLFSHDDFPDVATPAADPEIQEALRAAYNVLSKIPADERIAFTLRFIDQMDLAEIASACRVSLATVKRRVFRAKLRFEKIASQYDELSDWVKGRP